jgi:hypothetical protein
MRSSRDNLGNALQSQDKLDEAVASYQRALELDPGKYEALHNLGNALQAQGKLDEAMSCYERVLAVQPAYAKAHYSIGCLHHALGDLDEALVCYRVARALEPDLVQAGFSESLAQLLQGDFAAGWLNFEWRWQTKEHNPPMRAYPQPLWTGEKLARERLLVWGEQGVGDEIMFAGLIPDVIRSGTRCVLDCDARLKPLFARSFPSVEVISNKDFGGLAVTMNSTSPRTCPAEVCQLCSGQPALLLPRPAHPTSLPMRERATAFAPGMRMPIEHG